MRCVDNGCTESKNDLKLHRGQFPFHSFHNCRDREFAEDEMWMQLSYILIVLVLVLAKYLNMHVVQFFADRGRSGMYEKQNQEDHFRSLFLRNGGAALLPQGYREKALGRVLDLGSGEPRTMVVKKTPKRVHNSDPNAMFTRPELLMLEESAKGPRSIPHLMFTPSNKQGR